MTLDGRVPLDRPHVVIADIATGAPVRAQTWSDMATLAHWVAGRGTVLVPQHKSMTLLDSAGGVGSTSDTWRYYVRPQGRAIARVWVFDVRSPTGYPGELTVQPLEIPSTVSSAYIVEPPAYGQRMAPIVYVEGAGVESELTRSASDQEITCEIVCTAGRVEVVSCAVWELPRAALTQDSTDLGIGLDGYFPRRPINAGVSYQSVKGLFALTDGLTQLIGSRPRTRSGHIGRWGPELVTASSSALSLHKTDYRIVPGLDRASDTTTTCTAYVYAYRSGGTSADWRVVTGSGGASGWQAFTNTSYQWLGPLTFAVSAEDPTTSDGFRGGSPDTVRFEVRGNGGATVSVQGWCVLE